jgi:hypothetical protein
MLGKLTQAYQAAKSTGKTDDDTIEFEGHTFLLGYTRHLIEYLDGHLAPNF